MVKRLVYLLFLTVHAVTDIREKQIYVTPLVLQGVAGIMFQLCSGQRGVATALSCLPGLICLGVGRLSGEKIGYGDGWMVLLSGLYLSPAQMTVQLFWSFLTAFFYAAWVLATGRLSEKSEIPFAPFFLIGYFGGVLYGQR